ncbi:MAG TPA: 50S ribosomal protein L25 [Firmicutes bacterium]|jgi:large subunit ribosomal protein L25|nr:50S ribosomal protein L25 [Bacillota bacterium]
MEFLLAASVREELGKQKAGQLRQQGQIPAVLYGEGKENEHLILDAHELQLVFMKGGKTKLINLKIKKGKKEEEQHVLVKDFQKNPLKGNVIHVDFFRVAMDHLVTVKTPVHLKNEDKRKHDGAVLEMVLHELEISCLPSNIPDRIDVDVKALAMGSGIHVKDLELPEGIKVVNSPEEAVVMAIAPTAAIEAPAPVATEAAPAATGTAPAATEAKKE